MSLEKARISWTAKQISTMVKQGKINFDHIVQRGFVWERSRKSSLIESLILGYPVPPIFAKKSKDNNTSNGNIATYYIMDGKQRLNTIKEFVNNEFALTELPPVTYLNDETLEYDTENISNLKFKQLPEALKNYLLTITFDVIYFENLNEFEEQELFRRLNNGKQLSTKSKMLCQCKDVKTLIDIGSHKLFTEMLSKKIRENKHQAILIMKSWSMLNNDINDISFESKKFNILLQKADISEDDKLKLNMIFDYVIDIHSALEENDWSRLAKKIYTETHFISLVPYFNYAIENNIPVNLMIDWLKEFYGNSDQTSISEIYNAACLRGSASPISISTRNTELEKSFNDFFKED